jgi:hypothetical protein
MLLPRRDEPLPDATLIEHLDGAGVEPSGSRSVEILAGAWFDDDDAVRRERTPSRRS